MAAKVTMADSSIDEEVEPELAEEELTDLVDPEEYTLSKDFNDQPRTVEDLEPDEPLWEDGPTAGQIIEWKKQYGDVYVTSVTLDVNIVWRTLNRLEYKKHVKNMEQLSNSDQASQADISMINEELIAEMCILFPKFDRNQLVGELAGIPSIIAQEVMEASGFVALEVRQL